MDSTNNNNLNKGKNIIFKKQKNLIDNYQISSDQNSSIDIEFISTFEIYYLKNIKKSFYIAFPQNNEEGLLKIVKYNYISHKNEEIYSLKNQFNIRKIKYFYEPLTQKEYLFIGSEEGLFIFLIKNEKEYELIDSVIKEGKTGGFCSRRAIIPIYNFEIIYDKFEKKSYLIVLYSYRCGCITKKNETLIYKFQEKEINLIKEFSYRSDEGRSLLLLYEDNYKQKIYLITYINQILRYIEISDKLNDYKNCDDLPNIFNTGQELKKLDISIMRTLYKYGCIVPYREKDLLFLCNEYGHLLIIDLVQKRFIDNLNLNFNINSVINFCNNKIIFGSRKSFLIFDIDLNKIISNYEYDYGKYCYLISVKKFVSEEDNFYSLIIDYSDSKIRLFYL